MTAVTLNKNTEPSADKTKVTAKNNVFRRRFINDIIDSKRTAIVHCILCLLGLPLLCSLALVLINASSLENYEDSWKIIGMVIPFVPISIGMGSLALLLGIVIALFNFSYLYRKTIADMHYSLPLSGNQRFFADFLSGLAVYTVPFIISDIIGGLILKIGFCFIEVGYYEIGSIMTFYLHSSVICIITMMLYYSLCVLALTFCGSTFEAIFSSVVSIFMIPAVVLCFWANVIASSGYGLDFSSVMGQPLLTSTNPIGAIVFYVRNYIDSLYIDNMDNSYLNSAMLKWSIISFLFAIAFTAFSFLLYKLRKAEDVSKPYVFKSYFYIMLTMGVFCVVSLFKSGFNTIMPAVVISAVMWFIMEVITRRGFKRFWTAIVSFAVSVAIVIGLTGICRATQGFGISKKVPSAASVETIVITTDMVKYMSEYGRTIALKDRDVIETAVNTHKAIIDTFEKLESMDQTVPDDEMMQYIHDVQYIELTYKTFTGKEINRSYSVSSEDIADLMGSIFLSDEYADLVDKRFGKYEIEKGMVFDISDRFSLENKQIFLNDSQAREFRNAYRADLDAMTKDDLPNLGNVKYVIEDIIDIPEFFENTLSVLENIGIDLPETNISAFNYDVEISLYPEIMTYFYPADTFVDSRALMEIYHDSMTVLNHDNNSVIGLFDKNYCIDLENPDSIELINRLVPNIYKEKPIAVVNYGGNTFYLTNSEENRKLLDKYVVEKLNQDMYYYD